MSLLVRLARLSLVVFSAAGGSSFPSAASGFFCFALEEGEEELVVTHLLAFGSVDAGEES